MKFSGAELQLIEKSALKSTHVSYYRNRRAKMYIMPHSEKMDVNTLVLRPGEVVMLLDLINHAVKEDAIDQASSEENSLVWVRSERSMTEVCYRLGYLRDWVQHGVVLTEHDGLKFLKDLQTA